MNENVKNSPWAIAFKKESPAWYAQGLTYAQQPDVRVAIVKSDETGSWVWAIVTLDAEGAPTDFWLDAKDTKKEAKRLCARMGWVVVRLPKF